MFYSILSSAILLHHTLSYYIIFSILFSAGAGARTAAQDEETYGNCRTAQERGRSDQWSGSQCRDRGDTVPTQFSTQFTTARDIYFQF